MLLHPSRQRQVDKCDNRQPVKEGTGGPTAASAGRRLRAALPMARTEPLGGCLYRLAADDARDSAQSGVAAIGPNGAAGCVASATLKQREQRPECLECTERGASGGGQPERACDADSVTRRCAKSQQR